jgi:hypothetical protein
MKRSRRISAQRRTGTSTQEGIDQAYGYQRSSFWQMIAEIAEAETKANDNRSAPTHYVVPRLPPVFVVTDGSIVYARKQPRGDNTIVVDHGNDWLTVYAGLEHMFVPHSDRMPRYDTPLKGGNMLGYVGSSKEFKPLHFELWKRSHRHTYDQVDPIRFMRRWRQIDWSDTRLERELGPPHT